MRFLLALAMIVSGAEAPEPEPVVERAAAPVTMDSGRPQVVSATVTGHGAQGIASVTLDVLGTSVPMTRGSDGRYQAEFLAPPVRAKTVTRLAISVRKGDGSTVRRALKPTTVWPAREPVVRGVAPATPVAEPGDRVTVRAHVTSDASAGARQVVIYAGERGVGVLRPATGLFTGTVDVGDAKPGTRLRLSAVAEDANGKRSRPAPFELTVGQRTGPQIVASRMIPGRAVLVGQPVTLELEASSGPGLAAARLAIPGSKPVDLPRVSGDGHRAVYRGTWTPPPGLGAYPLALQAVDVNGRIAQRDLSISVVDRAAAEVASVSGPGTLNVAPGWAMLTITAAVEGQVDQAWAECGATIAAMTRVSEPMFRQTISLPPDTAPGRVDCSIRVIDSSGISSAPKHLVVTVKRVATFQRFEVKRGKVSGALYAVNGTGGAYGHLNDARVDLLFKREGKARFRKKATVTTSGEGTFTKRLTKKEGEWMAVYRGSSAYAPVTLHARAR